MVNRFAFCFINPARYTYQLMEKTTHIRLLFMEAYRRYCNTPELLQAGIQISKVSGLTPITTPNGSKAFGEAWMIIECKKTDISIYSPDAINDPEVKSEWINKPLHKMYIGEILNVWIK